MSNKRARAGFFLVILLAPFSPALAQETVTYTFDALGRMIGVTTSGGTVGEVEADYAYDGVGNRTTVSVKSPNGNGGEGPTDGTNSPESEPLYVVVPLNGYTLVRVR